MSWGCKPENYPDGCGWAQRLIYPRMGWEEWWCDTCERAGDCITTPTTTALHPTPETPTNQAPSAHEEASHG